MRRVSIPGTPVTMFLLASYDSSMSGWWDGLSAVDQKRATDYCQRRGWLDKNQEQFTKAGEAVMQELASAAAQVVDKDRRKGDRRK